MDDVWLKTSNQKGFTQREPFDGQPATNDTRFYILYDESKIYFLFFMLDDDPASIPARLVDRDYRFYPDDSINFYLDTYNDNRKAFYFSTNPFGVKQDGLLSENGENMDMSWDGIFDVDARINNFGWVAEFAIPFKTLRFNDKKRYQIWGFNVFRIRKESRETSYWSPVSQNYQNFRLDLGGVLIGMKKTKSGRNLNLLPYFTSRRNESPAAGDYDANAGLDIKYGITSDLTMDLTVNPDFGQVEIDEEQINLDKRFEVQLEEKRPFFMENSTLFQTPYYQLFYSRRIGAQSDIKGGAKFTGKIGKYSVGLLGVSTGDWKNSGLGDPDAGPPDEFFSVARVQRDILASSNIGVTVVDRQVNPGGGDHRYNRAGSVDWTIYHGQQYFIGQAVYSDNSYRDFNAEPYSEQGGALYGQYGYYGRLIWLDLHGTYYQPEFNIDSTGYFRNIRGKGRRQAGLYIEAHPFVNNRFIRSWGISIKPIFIKDTDESKAGWGVENKAWLELSDQSRISAGFTRYRDIESDLYFYAFGRGQQPELLYWGRDFFVELDTDEGKMFSLYLRGNFDSQYYFQTHSSGYNQGLEAALRFKPFSNFFLQADFEMRRFLDRDLEKMPLSRIGQPEARVWGIKGRYLFSKTIFSRAFLQKTNAAEAPYYDSEQQRVLYAVWDRISANILLGWRFRPLSTIYLAYTEEWSQRFSQSYQTENRIIFLKFSYYWSL